MYHWTITFYYEPHEVNTFVIKSNTPWNTDVVKRRFIEKHLDELDSYGYTIPETGAFDESQVVCIVEKQNVLGI